MTTLQKTNTSSDLNAGEKLKIILCLLGILIRILCNFLYIIKYKDY